MEWNAFHGNDKKTTWKHSSWDLSKPPLSVLLYLKFPKDHRLDTATATADTTEPISCHQDIESQAGPGGHTTLLLFPRIVGHIGLRQFETFVLFLRMTKLVYLALSVYCCDMRQNVLGHMRQNLATTLTLFRIEIAHRYNGLRSFHLTTSAVSFLLTAKMTDASDVAECDRLCPPPKRNPPPQKKKRFTILNIHMSTLWNIKLFNANYHGPVIIIKVMHDHGFIAISPSFLLN